MIAAIMPARGRIAQTLDVIPRLLSTAQYDDWQLWVMVDGDAELYQALQQAHFDARCKVVYGKQRAGYWRAMRAGLRMSNADMVVNLANDLLPGTGWLQHAMETFAWQNPQRRALVAFNDGIHHGHHAAHCLTTAEILSGWYGADFFPVMYYHLYADAELTARAQAEGIFRADPWAVLFHNHPYTGGKPDVIYEEGHEQQDQDKALFERRRANAWKAS
jgi:glycosyltransferase involved in cell wall biosynthesis